jgi:hypothetical protein
MTKTKRSLEYQIAEVAHEVNRTYCASLGDFSQLKWVDAPDWQKDSCAAGVRKVMDLPSCTPKDLHEHWLYYKAKEGWTYGPVKNTEKKTHPCMLPYYSLPLKQRQKAEIFHWVVRGELALVRRKERGE